MMAIKSGTLVADDSWSTSGPIIKQENQLILSHSFKDIQPIIPVAACSNNDVMVKVEEHGLE
jgi:hypothetical protein